MTTTLTILNEYGYVLLVFVETIFMLIWLGVQVGKARKKFKVPYPTMYENDPKSLFNCVQRGHQNTLEEYPYVIFTLLFAGIQHPLLAALAGQIWIFGRVHYAKGYATGDPKGRLQGAYKYIGQIILLVLVIKLAVSMVYPGDLPDFDIQALFAHNSQ